MDYYRLRNMGSDTDMRDSIANSGKKQGGKKKEDDK